jgi:hypothetical protein
MITQTFLLIFLFAFLFAACRELSEHGKEGGFIGFPDWWNTPLSHRNKYIWNKKYLPFLPNNIGQFIFRKVLVWLTDAEHFFQFLSLLCVLAMVLILSGWQLVLVAYLGQALAGLLKSFTKIK